MNTAIRIENLGKAYRRGMTHPGSVRELLSQVTKKLTGRKRRESADVNSSGTGAEDTDRFWALRDVSFDVRHGEVMGIVGSNGAGKSTLLKILSCITDPTEGSVEIDGRVASLLEVGTGFHGELTGRENVFLNGVILGMSRAEIRRKFDEIVAFSGVESFIDTPVKRYSSGMYIRLAFAVAAHLDAEILVVDEVLAVGDVAFQRKCMGKMNDIAASGRTVLFVSHNMAAVQSLCTSGCLFEEGRLITCGSTSETLQEYRQRTSTGAPGRLGYFSILESRQRLHQFFRSVSVLDECNRNVVSASAGGSLKIRLGLDSAPEFACPQISINFNDCTGHRILSLQSPVTAPASDGACEIDCCVPSLPLAPGEYWLELTATVDDSRIDAVEVSEALRVTDSELTRRVHGVHHGVCVADSEWVSVANESQVLNV